MGGGCGAAWRRIRVLLLLLYLLLVVVVVGTTSSTVVAAFIAVPSTTTTSRSRSIPWRNAPTGIIVDRSSAHSRYYQHREEEEEDPLRISSGVGSTMDEELPNNRIQRTATTTDDTLIDTDTVTSVTRRALLFTFFTTAANLHSSTTTPAHASVPELDASGNLYTPMSEMWRGGSVAARGEPLRKVSNKRNHKNNNSKKNIVSIYETRFVAYLARFLLNYDPAARSYWTEQGHTYTWDQPSQNNDNDDSVQASFAQFAQSVEVGLADYFSGPFGSYSSVSVALAGLGATDPAKSQSPSRLERSTNKAYASAKQGVYNLYSLLKARYRSKPAKLQLAILFSFVSEYRLQPVSEIRSLLGEVDNATISQIQLQLPTFSGDKQQQHTFRTSSRCGGGYSLYDVPSVVVDDPPPLGAKYKKCVLAPQLQPTGRILAIQVTDPGSDYTSIPMVKVVSNSNGVLGGRECQAAAILDRHGHVDSIIVLDPGSGYGGGRSKQSPPRIVIDPPRSSGANKRRGTRATATAILEYKLTGITIVQGGNGFVNTEPPKISISPPVADPDWYFDSNYDIPPVQAVVSEMMSPDGTLAYSRLQPKPKLATINDDTLERLSRDPLELLPSSARPELILDPTSNQPVYCVRQLANVPQFVAVMLPRYRAFDPVFGGVGRLPVTKGATALTASEYSRLALSGGVCTVIVRTLLNPLELIKTKQQLQNDDELTQYIVNKVKQQQRPSTGIEAAPSPVAPSTISMDRSLGGQAVLKSDTVTDISTTASEAIATAKKDTTQLGTVEMIKAVVELRGPLALFQSSDVTFLASVMFGSFGFGATELFRRSFTEAFEGGSNGSETVLLLAASLATVLTAGVASPFEVLRVRSMGEVESKSILEVLNDFVQQNRRRRGSASSDLTLRDVLPLWTGFAPILSRELPFAIAKFITFDLISTSAVAVLNSQAGEGSLPVQVGVGTIGLTVSALSGAIAGIAGAFVSHPADLILTKTSANKKQSKDSESTEGPEWVTVIKELVSQDGGLSNLFVGLGSRSVFFFLVIGLQFFLYDYIKNLFQVGSDDLSLVLDVFYAVRAGLLGMDITP